MLKNANYNFVVLLEYFVNLTKFSKTCEILKHNINLDLNFEPYECFTRLDRSSKGYIDKDDIIRFLKENNYIFPHTEYKNLNLFFEFYDKNSDGKILFREFLIFILNKRQPHLRAESTQRETKKLEIQQFMSCHLETQIKRLILKEITMLEWANKKKISIFLEKIDLLDLFLFLDKNKDGYLCAEDIRIFFEKYEIYTSFEDVQSLIALYDQDGDNKLDWNEFLILIMPSKLTFDYDYLLLKEFEKEYTNIYFINEKKLEDLNLNSKCEVSQDKPSMKMEGNIDFFREKDYCSNTIGKQDLNYDYSETREITCDFYIENKTDYNKNNNYDQWVRNFFLELFEIVQMDKEIKNLKYILYEKYSYDIWKIFKIFEINKFDYYDYQRLKYGFEYFDLFLTDDQILLIYNKLNNSSGTRKLM
jgi:Ca2+-binding EF-hand superfamily protein